MARGTRLRRCAAVATAWLAPWAATVAAEVHVSAAGKAGSAVPRLAAGVSPPRIDGVLDDAAWALARTEQTFVQSAPMPGAAASVRTEVRWLQDGAHLYVAVRAHDAAPARVAARSLRRDAEAIDGDDHVTVVLDPRGSGGNGFFFRVNAAGARRDGLIFDGATARAEWDAVWDAAGRIDAEGWSVEMAIPLAALAAPADGRDWRVNVQRYVAATGERMNLHSADTGRDIETLADAGPLRGVTPDATGWGLRLRPGLRWAAARRAGEAGRQRLEPSLEAFWQAAPGVTATATVNTDFADAELDDRTLNLSRFELFRPEKRSFFTQDAGRFAFGGLATDKPELLPFFSRRIGLGQVLDAGLKLSGSAGPVEFGALAVQVERAGRERAPRAGVLRLASEVARALGGSHRLGLIATQGHPEGVRGSALEGVDYQYRNTAWLGDGTLDAHAWAQRSHNAGVGTGAARGGSIRMPNFGPWAELNWRRVEAAFLPALGFVQEAGIDKADLGVGWKQRLEGGHQLLPRLFIGTRRRLDGSERSRFLGPNLEWTSAQGDLLGVEAFAERDQLAEAFELLPGVTVRGGAHRWTYGAVYAETSNSRAVSGELALVGGGYYDGRLQEQKLALAWRPTRHWTLAATGNRQDVRLASGRFIARSTSLRLEHAANTRSHQSLVVQHDNVSGLATLGLRARWEVAPGREWLAALDRVRPVALGELQTLATLKLLWNWER